jgi:hypothetical protein
MRSRNTISLALCPTRSAAAGPPKIKPQPRGSSPFSWLHSSPHAYVSPSGSQTPGTQYRHFLPGRHFIHLDRLTKPARVGACSIVTGFWGNTYYDVCPSILKKLTVIWGVRQGCFVPTLACASTFDTSISEGSCMICGFSIDLYRVPKVWSDSCCPRRGEFLFTTSDAKPSNLRSRDFRHL